MLCQSDGLSFNVGLSLITVICKTFEVDLRIKVTFHSKTKQNELLLSHTPFQGEATSLGLLSSNSEVPVPSGASEAKVKVAF